MTGFGPERNRNKYRVMITNCLQMILIFLAGFSFLFLRALIFPSRGTHFDFVTLVIAKLLARVSRLDTFPFHSGGGKNHEWGRWGKVIFPPEASDMIDL